MQFRLIGNFELVYCFESTVNELHVALCFASPAASIPEIRSLKLQNYAWCIFASQASFARFQP